MINRGKGFSRPFIRMWPVLAIFAALFLTLLCLVPTWMGGKASAQAQRVTKTQQIRREPRIVKRNAPEPTQQPISGLRRFQQPRSIRGGSASHVGQSTGTAEPNANPNATSTIFYGSDSRNIVNTLSATGCVSGVLGNVPAPSTNLNNFAPIAVEPTVLQNPAQTTAGRLALAAFEEPTPGTFLDAIVLMNSAGGTTVVADTTTTPAVPFDPLGLAFDFTSNPNLFFTGDIGGGVRAVFKYTNTAGTIAASATPVFSETVTNDFRPVIVAVRPNTGDIYVLGFHPSTNADDIFLLTPDPAHPGQFTGASAFATGANFADPTRDHIALAFNKTGTLFVGSTDLSSANGSIEKLNPVAAAKTYTSGTLLTGTLNLGDIRQIAVTDDGTNILLADNNDPTNTQGAIIRLNSSTGALVIDCANGASLPTTDVFFPSGVATLVTSCNITVTALPSNVTANCTAAGGVPATDAVLAAFFSGATATSSCGTTVTTTFTAPIGPGNSVVDLSTAANRTGRTFPLGTTTVTITFTEPTTGLTSTTTRTVTVNQAPPTISINQTLLQTPSLAGITVAQLLAATTATAGPCGPAGTPTITAFRLVNGVRVPLASNTVLPLGQTPNIGFTVTFGTTVFNLNPGTQGVPTAITVQFLCADPANGNRLVVTVPANGISGTGSYTFTSGTTVIANNITALIQLNQNVLRVRTNVPSLNALADGTQGTCQAILFDTTRNQSFVINAFNIRTTP